MSLEQPEPDDTIEIDLDLGELDATSAETKATYQEIKDYVLKEFGLKVSNLYISQIKRKYKGAITAFAGVAPGVNESGSYEKKVFQLPNEIPLISEKLYFR